jgi:hypothetical protein
MSLSKYTAALLDADSVTMAGTRKPFLARGKHRRPGWWRGLPLDTRVALECIGLLVLAGVVNVVWAVVRGPSTIVHNGWFHVKPPLWTVAPGQGERGACAMRTQSDIDPDTLAEYERNLMVRPSNYGRHTDYGQYETHAPVYAVAINADDVLAESNWHAMLDMVNGAARDGFDDVHDLGESHWGWGPIDVIYVRVRDECTGRFTPAWIEAVGALLALQDYPVLDESDYSDREYAAWESTVNDAVDCAIRGHREDTDADRQAFYALLTRQDGLMDTFGYPSDSVDWDRVAKAYATVRDEHYTWLGQRELAASPWLTRVHGMVGDLPLW